MDKIVLGEHTTHICGISYLNSNLLIVGPSGSGKTTGVIVPNMYAFDGLQIITDPKGSLFDLHKENLKSKGFTVHCIDFNHQKNSTLKYNPLRDVCDVQDVKRTAYQMIYANENRKSVKEPYWNEASEQILEYVLMYALESKLYLNKEYSMRGICALCTSLCKCLEPELLRESDRIIKAHEAELNKLGIQSIAAELYYRTPPTSDITSMGILSTLQTAVAPFVVYQDIPDVPEYDIKDLLQNKTILFLTVSDVDHSNDGLVSLFYSQLFFSLCQIADNSKNHKLNVSTRVILDDFANTCKINDFNKIVAGVRSRNISVFTVLQSESQLSEFQDGVSIINNHDTYLYLGGSDTQTVKSISERTNLPFADILTLPLGECVILQRGSKPKKDKVISYR